MKNVLLKTTNLCDNFEIEQFFKKRGINTTLEGLKHGDKVKTGYDFCILKIDYENEDEYKRALNFVDLNKDLKIFAYINKCNRSTLIKAHKLGCYACINKVSDIDEDFFRDESPQIKPKETEVKINEEFAGTKILIVDDIIENIKILEDVLSPFKFEFYTHTNPLKALETIEDTLYDLIMLDISMPDMDGFQLAKEIRASDINARTPIIFISAHSEKQKKIEGYNLGSLAYIEKPIDPQTVIAQIYGILMVRKLNNQLLMEKENFIAMLTHDLKTPIRAQIQALDLLLKDYFGNLNDKQREIINEIMASNKYMQNMAENVLTNYKTENGKLKIQKSRNNLKTTIENTLENLKFIISQKNQSINVIYKNVESAAAYYDEIEIKRVLSNLIVNASEYSFDNSQINISVEKEDDTYKITVSDTGLGIQTEDLNHLFSKYSTNSKDYRKVGTGLGLYICKAIINAHGGTIEAKRLEGGGTSFMFTLNKEPSLKTL